MSKPKDASRIRELLNEGLQSLVICQRMKCSPSTVARVKRAMKAEQAEAATFQEGGMLQEYKDLVAFTMKEIDSGLNTVELALVSLRGALGRSEGTAMLARDKVREMRQLTRRLLEGEQ